jgi:hypothetical protein
MGKFTFQNYLIFMSFYIYRSFLFFGIPEYMKLTYLLCTDVGPVCPTDFLRTRWHPRLEVGPAGAVGLAEIVGGPPSEKAKRVLRRVQRNLIVLTHIVPMVEIEDLSPSMQPHVVGVPWTWV